MTSDPTATDAALASAAADGDRAAFAAIYDRYADRLHDFCTGVLRDRDAAADCVQDTFCSAATKLGQLRDGDKLRPWLYSIARNEALKQQRQWRREQPTDALPDTETTEDGPETMATRTELADLVADAVGGLSERDQTILDLTYRHGLDGIELAEVLGVSRTNAGTLVHRMRDTVERTLGALLVARRVDRLPQTCPELAGILNGWNGEFTVLLRKRVARHIESCDVCEAERRRLVTPAALLGGAPVFLPAPDWLREVTLTAASLPLTAAPSGTGAHRKRAVAGLVLAGLIVGASVTIATLPRSVDDVGPVVATTPEVVTSRTAPAPLLTLPPAAPPPSATTSVMEAPRIAPPITTTTIAPVETSTAAEPSEPTTKTTTEVTQSFSPTVRSTPDVETETEEPTETTTPRTASTTKPSTTRRPMPTGTFTVVTTTQPPIIS